MFLLICKKLKAQHNSDGGWGKILCTSNHVNRTPAKPFWEAVLYGESRCFGLSGYLNHQGVNWSAHTDYRYTGLRYHPDTVFMPTTLSY